MLKTEAPSDAHPDLDLYATGVLVDAFIDDQREALVAVRAAGGRIAMAVDAAVPRIAGGGRLMYVGAGTSGRLGVLDSVELYPTFSWPRDRALALIAGGQQAMYEAVEGAEDSREQGAADLRAAEPTARDVVILLAASGTTPYVMGALAAAHEAGALTIGIANNPGAPVVRDADIGITLNTGSEIISGSTRLKAGTSQKIALNTLSSAIMVRLHKVYGNLMVDVHPTNAKLYRRAVTLTTRATGASEDVARRTLQRCDYRVKEAIVALLQRTDVATARSRLAAAQGSVRMALASEMDLSHSPETDMNEDRPTAKNSLSDAKPGWKTDTRTALDRDIDRDLRRDAEDGTPASSNRDPITDAPGAHPLGVGVGAAAGGMAAGAAVGTVAGPIGTAIGAAIGAVIGGLAGKGVAEMIDPTLEDEYWRDNYVDQPYVPSGASYDDYGPAYRYGVSAFTALPDARFEDAHDSLSANWLTAREGSELEWKDANQAVRDGWERAHNSWRANNRASDDVEPF